MVLKAVLLWKLFTSSRVAGSHSNSDEKGKRPETATDSPDRSNDGDQIEFKERDQDLEHGNGDEVENVDDIIEDDDEADPDDVDVDDPPSAGSRGRRFGRTLSISRTFTTVSTLRDIYSIQTPNWVTKVKEFFRPTKSELNYYIPNYRHTPIFSGIVIPFSILLEIPGLTEHWYVQTAGDETVNFKENPVILDVGLAFSMACAVIANICLVIRFLEKRVLTMTILCIIFLTVHDIINIIAVTTFGVMHHEGFTYGQAFWMTMCSTVVSFLTNITLIVDLVRTPNFSKSGSGLTRRQRSLVVVVIILLSYIAFGALVNTFTIHLTFVNALYFTVVTIETIGFGDITPRTPGARVFECIYACFGILNLGLAVAMTRETVLEALQVSYQNQLKQVRERRRAARRKRKIERLWREAVEWRLREVGAPIWVRDDFKHNAWADARWFLDQVVSLILWPWQGYVPPRYTRYGYGHHPHGKHLNLEALTRSHLEAAAMEAGVPLDTLLPPWFSCCDDGPDVSIRTPDSPPDNQNMGEVIMEGLTGLWGERRSRDEHGQEVQAMPLTHARLGRMISMLRKFALSMYESSEPATSPESRDSSPMSRSGSAVDADADDSNPNVTNVEQVASGSQMKADTERKTLDQDAPLGDQPSQYPPTRFASPVNAMSRANISLPSQEPDSDRIRLASEDKKANLGQVTVVWILFILFWTVGSAIFMATEGWSYGNAVYFCFIAFTTIGYGDLSPETPAGRSVFVVWALLGVGTVTVLISVLSETYSSHYKNAITTHVFDKAVKRYRQRTRMRPRIQRTWSKRTVDAFPLRSLPSFAASQQAMPLIPSSDTQSKVFSQFTEPYNRAQQQIDSLPIEILRRTQVFREHVQYFVGPGRKGKDVLKRMPVGLKQLLCDITDVEKIGERVKEEILQDDAARQTLFTLSIEQSLRGIMEIAEETLNAIEERDQLVAMQRSMTDTQQADRC